MRVILTKIARARRRELFCVSHLHWVRVGIDPAAVEEERIAPGRPALRVAPEELLEVRLRHRPHD